MPQEDDVAEDARMDIDEILMNRTMSGNASVLHPVEREDPIPIVGNQT